MTEGVKIEAKSQQWLLPLPVVKLNTIAAVLNKDTS